MEAGRGGLAGKEGLGKLFLPGTHTRRPSPGPRTRGALVFGVPGISRRIVKPPEKKVCPLDLRTKTSGAGVT